MRTVDRTGFDIRNCDWNGEGAVVLVDKPIDWTSFDVVRKLRSLFRLKKIGHAGTLDPKASGLLIVCTGAMTKSIHKFVGLEKEYEGTLELGAVTPSYDSETEIVERRAFDHIRLEEVVGAARSFVGRQEQVPPMYSAAKYGGRPLYRYAREGKTVRRSGKEIEVMEFSALDMTQAVVQFRIVCSKGTYVRTLVGDLGEKLGCGAMLRSLRRTRIGSHMLKDALTIEELSNLKTQATHSAALAHGHRSSV